MPIYSDVDMELTMASNGDVTRNTEDDAIRNSLSNIMNTIQGSRRMLPEFAFDIMGLLFEPMEDATSQELGRRILGAIELWEDRIIVENVNVHANHRKNQYEITLTYRTVTSNITQTVNYILKQG